MDRGTAVFILAAICLLVFGGLMLGGSSGITGIKWVDNAGNLWGFEDADGKPRISSTSYTYDIGEGNIANHTSFTQIGYNGALVANTEADVWSKAGVYTFPTAEDHVHALSSSAGDEDTGVAIFNGTSTGGSLTVLIDVAKNFNAGVPVEVGDCVVLDKSGASPAWGYVTAVTNNTALTLSGGFSDGGSGSGRDYFVIDKNAAGKTGAQAVIFDYLDDDYLEYSEIIILNGDSAVDSVNKNIFRVNEYEVIATGTGAKPVGDLSLTDHAGTAFRSFITRGYTRARCIMYTVPAGKTIYITGFTAGYAHAANQPHYCRIYTRANVDPSTRLNTRDIFYPYTEVLSATGTVYVELVTPTKLPEKTDIKVSAIADYAGVVTVALRGWIEDN